MHKQMFVVAIFPDKSNYRIMDERDQPFFKDLEFLKDSFDSYNAAKEAAEAVIKERSNGDLHV